MEKERKKLEVSALREVFNGANIVIVTKNNGLKVNQTKTLRNKIRSCGSSYKVAKNRLVKIALKDTDYEHLEMYFNGPTAIAYSSDPVSVAKALHEFMKDEENIELVAGAMGRNVLSADQIKQLASLPSLDELRAKIIGLISAPATKIAGVLQAPAGQIARLTSAYSKK